MRPKLLKIAPLTLCVVMLTASLGSDGSPPEYHQGEWLPVPPQSLDIQAGSALDFSAMVPENAGYAGPLRLDGQGRLILGDSTNPRFNCAMISNSPKMGWELPDHAAADALAVQLRRHGYNLVRFHYMDGRLMRGAKADYAFPPENVDRFYYLLAALKRNGVYWMLDMLTSYDGARLRRGEQRSVNNLKARLNFDPKAQAEWLKMVDAVYARPNPYTGQSPLSDPALAFVVGANENSLVFWSSISRDGPYPAGLAEKFDQWVHAEYPRPADLAALLPDLSDAEATGQSPIAPPANWDSVGPRMTLFLRFISSLEVRSYRWMEQKLRERGYAGPMLASPEWYKQLDNRTRSALPITDIHAYVGEVSSYAAGSKLSLPSMLDKEGLSNITTNAAARWLDRPLVSSEYGTPFPNPYRRESGMLFPAIASFQGFSTICRMANMSVEPAITSDGPAIFPYRVGIDPVARVAETLTALLFYRRDVAEGRKGAVVVPFGEAEKARLGSAFMPREVRNAVLLARFGMLDPDKVAAVPAPKTVVPLPQTPYGPAAKAFGEVVNLLTDSAEERERRVIGALRGNGTLPGGNLTDPSKGIYQSQTGQMTLDSQAGTLRIITPLTEALTTKIAARDIMLGAMSVESVDQGALVAASTLDGKPLAQSGRILLMLAANAINSNMAMAGRGPARSLIDWGRNPIMLQRVQATIRLRPDKPFNGTFSVLALNGSVMRQMPVSAAQDGTLSMTLDTGAVARAPTTWFLLERSH